MQTDRFLFGRVYEEDVDFLQAEYADLAIKLRDNYRTHDHEDADIVSVEEHDDIEYAEIMQYDEAVFIEDSETVTVHDIESGYTNSFLSRMCFITIRREIGSAGCKVRLYKRRE